MTGSEESVPIILIGSRVADGDFLLNDLNRAHMVDHAEVQDMGGVLDVTGKNMTLTVYPLTL